MRRLLAALAGVLLLFLVSDGQVAPNTTVGEFVNDEVPVIVINDIEITEEVLNPNEEPKRVEADPTIVVFTGSDVEIVARIMHAEANGLSDAEKKAVGWCILNRADAWGRTIQSVATEPNAFAISNEYTDDDLALAQDVLKSWAFDESRELPPEYLFFYGNGEENLFRKDFSSKERYSVI